MKTIRMVGDIRNQAIGCMVFALCLATGIGARAQTYTTLLEFNQKDGENPEAGLVQATNGYFYGTTFYGGTNPGDDGDLAGVLFAISPDGSYAVVHNFCTKANCADGQNPYALVLASNGVIYGTTYGGGTTCVEEGCGTIFAVDAEGAFRTIYNFCSQSGCADGNSPYAGLFQASNGGLYGTTGWGGANGYGTIFKVTGSSIEVLHSFDYTDGFQPWGVLTEAANGDLYGTTLEGGANGSGTVFKISLAGAFTNLYNFCSLPKCADGSDPYAGLTVGSNGDLYGTTFIGGSNAGGTVFKITPAGKLTTLYNFCSLANCADGDGPQAGLVLATDGNFYGAAESGGADGAGTIYKITPAGALTTIYNFCSQPDCADGSYPLAAPIQSTNGSFYGTASTGGVDEYFGTVYGISVGLPPFVETVPPWGKVGANVLILGTDLTGATSVTFNGIDATFTVVSATEITATVPTGATTGTVQVTTSSGTLDSNISFRVVP